MLRGLTSPRPEPERPPALHSDGSRSGPRAERRRGSGAGSKKMRSTDCASSKGPPPPTTPENSSLGDEDEESDGGQAPPERWIPPSPRAAEAAVQHNMCPRRRLPSGNRWWLRAPQRPLMNPQGRGSGASPS
jgi:hypothetical protein